MTTNVSNLLYLITIVTFILALRYLSNPAHARRGNQIGAVVGSQPFGGEGLSGTGPAGRNQVGMLVDISLLREIVHLQRSRNFEERGQAVGLSQRILFGCAEGTRDSELSLSHRFHE